MPPLREISADPPGNMKKEKENAMERLAFSFFLFGDGSRRRPDRLFSFFRPGGLRTKIEFIGFAYENRIHWLCGHSYANPARARATFSALSGAPVCVRKPNSLALRAVVRKPCRRPGHLFCSFRCPGLRTKTEFIGFAGSRTQTLQAPGPPFLLFSG